MPGSIVAVEPTVRPSNSTVRGVTATSPAAAGYRPDFSVTSASGPLPGSAVTFRYCPPIWAPIPSRAAVRETPGMALIAASCLSSMLPLRTTTSAAAGVPLNPSSTLRSVICWASTVANTTNEATSTARPVSSRRDGRRATPVNCVRRTAFIGPPPGTAERR